MQFMSKILHLDAQNLRSSLCHTAETKKRNELIANVRRLLSPWIMATFLGLHRDSIEEIKPKNKRFIHQSEYLCLIQREQTAGCCSRESLGVMLNKTEEMFRLYDSWRFQLLLNTIPMIVSTTQNTQRTAYKKVELFAFFIFLYEYFTL